MPMDNHSRARDWAASTADEFRATTDVIRKGTGLFVQQLKDGLRQDGTALLQVPSYVVKLPNGSEKGICLAIDLGGTNLRVCSVELHGDTTYSLLQSKVAIPFSLMTASTYKDLFHFIAKHTESFMLKNLPGEVEKWRRIAAQGSVTDEIRKANLHSLGFTFSFTFDQHAIDKGTLMYWTKSFSIDDAVGRDPCAMLQEAFDEIHLPLIVRALVNDTVGTLAARAYAAPGTSQTLLAAIFGTGTNGAYMERIEDITKLHGSPGFSNPGPDSFMALNTEWGGFDGKLEVLPVTRFDEALDRESVNPDDQHYEKRISGLYLGEILRRVLLEDLQSEKPCLGLEVRPGSRLYEPYSIDSSFLSEVVRDAGNGLAVAKQAISRALGVESVTTEDAEAIKTVAAAIGLRAARLSAIAIAGVVIQSGRLVSAGAPQSLSQSSLPPPKSFWGRFINSIMKPLRSLGKFLGLRSRKEGRQPAKDEESLGSDSSSDQVNAQPGKIIDIGVDGSLFEFFPSFEENLRIALREIPEVDLEGERRIRMGAAADGSGIGAALIAWSAAKQD
ncbi:glucokinase [Plectosphaerella plurivora]|uniref:Phosphotransferase n=1 Tax=Plectosphaerella plurivora TaxID=936078 RepID=A0A9P8VGS5_9PEZI|nr:glucokinase [Plectosphaerella plurivora]